jgi:DNA polymerase
MWRWLEAAIQDAIINGGTHTGYRVSLYTKGAFLFIRLPSGRRLSYYQPKVEMKSTPWGEVKPTFTYMGKHRGRAIWVRVKAHAGLIVENITQAIARDILACGLLEANKRGLYMILHVHDEIGARVPEQFKTEWLHVLIDAMCVVPEWAHGLLLKADGFTTKNYRKD